MTASAPLLNLLLLGLVLVAVAVCLVLLVRASRSAQAGATSEIPVLHERLSAREHEIAQLQQQLGQVQSQLQQEREVAITLRERLSRQETLVGEERNQSQEKIRLLQSAREQMTLEFRNLANEILEQKGKTFGETSRQQIQDILKPLGDKIQLFEKKVEDTYGKEAQQRFALEKEIKSLLELNARISVDAVNLTNALKGESKTQGIWGEVILERVLEKSGLQKGREYETQVSMKDDSGRTRQPDVVVHLPENKDVIIDSKVSLTAYEGYFSAGDEDTRATCLKQHIQSIRNHIKGLSGKNYQHLGNVRSLDYVLLFLPVEAAFTLAIQEDERLFTEAFEQNIILVGPSTLLATLRTIQNIWRYEDQNKNAIEIATQAGKLYDKFVAFTQDLEKLGERLNQTRQAYDAAHNKLSSGRGNVLGHVEKLKKLGARASKQLAAQGTDANDEDKVLPAPGEEEESADE
jgi:DNA recombination protein RmuC